MSTGRATLSWSITVGATSTRVRNPERWVEAERM
jgi:hypothetical protein